MASNSFGKLFRITTFGESHGRAIGVIIDGCPALLPLNESDIQEELDKRAPGQNPFTTPRREKDHAEILSGVFEGKTTGAPIAIVVYNRDADSSKYEPIKDLLRPGHANFTYLKKFGIFDYRGGGRSSARETIARVAAGAVAKKILAHYGIIPLAFISKLGGIAATPSVLPPHHLQQAILNSVLYCPDEEAEKCMQEKINKAKEEGDSLGAVIEAQVYHLPVGLGEPVYEKLEARLAYAMMGLPATKGIEFGLGFQASDLKGSRVNDAFINEDGEIKTETNHSGGTLGGISNGMPLVFRVAFKPTSSIMKKQRTVDIEGNPQDFQIPAGSRHDPCVAIRAVPIIEAMTACVLADFLLLNRCSRLEKYV